MRVVIDGSPQYLSQLITFLAWIENCKHRNRISEFKVRLDNEDNNVDIKFKFDDTTLQKQYEEFLKLYSSYNTTAINPIFYIGSKFKM